MDGCPADCEGMLAMPVLGLHLFRFEDAVAADSAAEEDMAEEIATEGCESIDGLGTVVALTAG